MALGTDVMSVASAPRYVQVMLESGWQRGVFCLSTLHSILQRGAQRLEERSGQAGGPAGLTDLHGDGGLGAAAREDGGLVQEVSQVGAAEAGHPHGNSLQVHIIGQLLVFRMHLGGCQQKNITPDTLSRLGRLADTSLEDRQHQYLTCTVGLIVSNRKPFALAQHRIKRRVGGGRDVHLQNVPPALHIWYVHLHLCARGASHQR